MNVPFLNLQAQYESLKTELLPTVEKALASGHYVLGPNVTALEQEVAAYTGAKFGVGVIIDAEGRGADARVQVNFRDAGVKWLALEYAKLEAA